MGKRKESQWPVSISTQVDGKDIQRLFFDQLRMYIANKSLHFTNQEVENLLSVVGKKKWDVHTNVPFGGLAQIIEYVGRYTHKVAITAHRILADRSQPHKL